VDSAPVANLEKASRQLSPAPDAASPPCPSTPAKKNEPIPLNEYLSAVNVQRRVLATLGLERRSKPVETLAECLAKNYPPDRQIMSET
jgi:hypothetical protein